MKKITILVLAVGFLTAALLGMAFWMSVIHDQNEQYRQMIAYYDSVGQTERQWLLLNQQPDGSLLMYEREGNTTNTIQPYFSNIAWNNLLYGEPSEPELEAVRRYIEWYFAHLNTEETDSVNGAGTMYDYETAAAQDGSIVAESKNKYDSVDSYAATFLVLLAHYGAVSQNTEWLKGYQTEINSVIDAMLRCMDESGITIVKKEYPIYFLMDNCEVNAGLKAAVELRNLGIEQIPGTAADRSSKESLEGYLLKNTEQIFHRFWMEEDQYYGTGFDEEGNRLPFSKPPEFYPELVEQIYPLVWGISDADHENARIVYERVCKEQPWENMQYKENGASVYNWTILAYAGALMGDEKRVNTFLERYRKELETGRSYPAYIDDAGWIIRTCEFMKNYYEGKIVPILNL